MYRITIVTEAVSQGNPGPALIGVSVIDDQGSLIEEVIEAIGNATDSFAEYQAVLRGLQVTREHFGVKTKEVETEVMLSNEVVRQQLSGELEIKDPGLVPHFIEIHNMRVSSFPNISFSCLCDEQGKEFGRLISRTRKVSQEKK